MVCSRPESCDVPRALMSVAPNHCCDETRTKKHILAWQLEILANFSGFPGLMGIWSQSWNIDGYSVWWNNSQMSIFFIWMSQIWSLGPLMFIVERSFSMGVHMGDNRDKECCIIGFIMFTQQGLGLDPAARHWTTLPSCTAWRGGGKKKPVQFP